MMQHKWDNKQNILEWWLRQQFYWSLMIYIAHTFENILISQAQFLHK